MPVPPLPLDVVQLIVEELRLAIAWSTASWAGVQKESLKNGLAVALVCKEWEEIGLALAWRTFWLRVKDERSARKLETLLGQRTTCARIKELELTVWAPAYGNNEVTFAAKVLASACSVISQCSSLRRIVFDIFHNDPQSVLEQLVASVSSPNFDDLHFNVGPTHHLEALPFLRTVALLPPLDCFDLILPSGTCNLGEEVTTDLNLCFSFRSFELRVPPETPGMYNGAHHLFRAIQPMLQPDALQECLVETHAAIFPPFISLMPNFEALKTLSVSAFSAFGFDILSSPVDLQVCLAALPPQVKKVEFIGLEFTWPPLDELPTLSELDAPERALCTVDCDGRVRGGNGEGGLIEKHLLPGEDAPKWYRVV
ncbi:hypothetical protein JCM6882_006879 [Rhodosporidiobolus microsporus]